MTSRLRLVVFFVVLLVFIVLIAKVWRGPTSGGPLGPLANVMMLHDSQAMVPLNIIILGDGFTAAQASMDAYHSAADAFANRLKEVMPFSAFTDTFNIYRVDVVSQEDGIDVPTSCGDYVYASPPPGLETWARTPRTRNTALGTTYCAAGSTRNTFIDSADWSSIWDYAHLPKVTPHLVIVLINDWMAGATAWADAGSGNGSGGVAFVSIRQNNTSETFPNSSGVAVLIPPQVPTGFPNVAIHEAGHLGPFRLRDEYGNNRSAVDPLDKPIIDGSPNLTTDTTAPIKWEAIRTPGFSIPHVCPTPPPNPPPVDPSLPDAGAAPGGEGYQKDVYHARCQCKMNSYVDTFCVVCRRQILDQLAWASTPWGASSGVRLILDSFRSKTFPPGNYFVEFKMTDGTATAVTQWPKAGTVSLAIPTVEPGLTLADFVLSPASTASTVTVDYRIFQDSSGVVTQIEQGTAVVPIPPMGRGSIELFNPASHRITFGVTRR